MHSNHGFWAAVFDGPSRPFRMERFPMPRLLADEVLIRSTCCTLCGSDFHTYYGRRAAPCPSILGHEVTGIVEDLAGEPRDFQGDLVRRGDRVTWSLVVSCGTCRLCRLGLPQKCEALFKYGHERCDKGSSPSGGLSQYCVLRSGTAIFKVPDCLLDPIASTASCATATVAAVLRSAGDVTGATVLIQGAGMLGLMAAAMTREAGAAQVVVIDPDAERSCRALAFGATNVLTRISHQSSVGTRAGSAGGADSQSAASRLLGTYDPKEAGEKSGLSNLDELQESLNSKSGFDVAMEFSGSPSAVETALPLLGIGGRYVVAGAVFPSPPASIDIETIVRKMIRISGVHNYIPQDLQSGLDFLARTNHTYVFASLIERSYPLDAVDEAIAFAEQARPARVAILP